MSVRKSLFLFLGALVLVSAGAFARPQTEGKPATKVSAPKGGEPRYVKPETPEQRMARLGTTEDPGPDPDPEKVFSRFGKQFTIFKAEKRYAKYLPEVGWVRPFAQANFAHEIYQENDTYVWVWSEIFDEEQLKTEAIASDNASQWPKQSVDYFRDYRPDFEPLDVPVSSVRIGFADSSAGLPSSGSWRNGGAVADMNGDGSLDLVLPPQRGPASVPSIFLGDGKGGWTRWTIKWPRQFPYGTVVAADFNKDKRLDLAFSIHLTGVAVFLGDGKGKFTEVTNGLDQSFPTRRMVASDVDADGWTDIVAISEGPVGRGKDVKLNVHGNMRAYLNRQKGQMWEGMDIAELREYVGGDYLSAGMFNGDRYPDFIGASVYFNSAFTIYNSKSAAQYDPLLDGKVVPGRSYYQATSTGRFLRGAKTDDALVSYVRYWPTNLPETLVPKPPLVEISGVDRISFADGQAKRTPILRWTGARPVRGMAHGDFDGDGNLDVAYAVADSTDLTILLGDGKGGFKRAEATGVKLPLLRTYDLIVTDLNRDKRPDIVVMFEAKQATATSPRNGSVKVYLNQGPQTP